MKEPLGHVRRQRTGCHWKGGSVKQAYWEKDKGSEKKKRKGEEKTANDRAARRINKTWSQDQKSRKAKFLDEFVKEGRKKRRINVSVSKV